MDTYTHDGFCVLTQIGPIRPPGMQRHNRGRRGYRYFPTERKSTNTFLLPGEYEGARRQGFAERHVVTI